MREFGTVFAMGRPYRFLTFGGALWHAFCYGTDLTENNRLWHGFCYACAPVKFFHVERNTIVKKS